MPREFALLTLLMEHTSHVVERQFLLEQVWGQSWFGNNNVWTCYPATPSENRAAPQ